MVGVNCFGLRSGKAVCLLAEWARLFHPGDRTLAHFKLAIFKSSFLLLRSTSDFRFSLLTLKNTSNGDPSPA